MAHVVTADTPAKAFATRCRVTRWRCVGSRALGSARKDSIRAPGNATTCLALSVWCKSRSRLRARISTLPSLHAQVHATRRTAQCRCERTIRAAATRSKFLAVSHARPSASREKNARKAAARNAPRVPIRALPSATIARLLGRLGGMRCRARSAVTDRSRAATVANSRAPTSAHRARSRASHGALTRPATTDAAMTASLAARPVVFEFT